MNNPVPNTAADSTKPSGMRTASHFSDWVQYFVSLAIVGAMVAWLLVGNRHSPSDSTSKASETSVPVSVSPDGQIEVDLTSPLGKKLEILTVHAVETREPILQVTGSVLASRRPGRSDEANYWQFNSTDLLDTFTSWEKARADIKFTETQLDRVRELATAKEGAMRRTIERLEKLVKAGTETEKDLTAQRTELMQTQILDGKEIYETETSIKTARRQENALALQLQQAGLDPQLLDGASADMDIVAADVPEGRVSRIVVGQSCQAKFYGLPEITFQGKVSTLSAIMSSQHRTLRVLFLLDDPEDRLRPGMFAEIGLGMDPRKVLRIPANSIIHVGRQDYVLVVQSSTRPADESKRAESDSGKLQVSPRRVVVQELINDSVEVESGVNEGEQILADNAVLLKPQLISALARIQLPVKNTSEEGKSRE